MRRGLCVFPAVDKFSKSFSPHRYILVGGPLFCEISFRKCAKPPPVVPVTRSPPPVVPEVLFATSFHPYGLRVLREVSKRPVYVFFFRRAAFDAYIEKRGAVSYSQSACLAAVPLSYADLRGQLVEQPFFSQPV